MEKYIGYPSWVNNINNLERWLCGHRPDKFDPRDAIINLLYPKTEENIDGQEQSISKISIALKPKHSSSVKISLSFKYISGTTDEVNECIKSHFKKKLNLSTSNHVFDISKTTETFIIKPADSEVSLEFTYMVKSSGSIKFVLANKNDATGPVDVDEETEDAVSEKTTTWRIKNWLKAVFDIDLIVSSTAGFDRIEDNASKFSYSASSGSVCNTINTSFRQISETELRITALPVYPETRYETWGSNKDYLLFNNLSLLMSSAQVQTHLRSLFDQIKYETAQTRAIHVKLASDKRFSAELKTNLESLDKEISAIEEGMRILGANSDALWSFMFLNSAMEKGGGKKDIKDLFEVYYSENLQVGHFVLGYFSGKYPSNNSEDNARGKPLLRRFEGKGHSDAFIHGSEPNQTEWPVFFKLFQTEGILIIPKPDFIQKYLDENGQIFPTLHAISHAILKCIPRYSGIDHGLVREHFFITDQNNPALLIYSAEPGDFRTKGLRYLFENHLEDVLVDARDILDCPFTLLEKDDPNPHKNGCGACSMIANGCSVFFNQNLDRIRGLMTLDSL